MEKNEQEQSIQVPESSKEHDQVIEEALLASQVEDKASREPLGEAEKSALLNEFLAKQEEEKKGEEVVSQPPAEIIQETAIPLFEIPTKVVPVTEQKLPQVEAERTEQEKVEPAKKYDFEATFNIKKDELESIAGWNDLSEGQAALLFDNLQQLTLARIQEDAIDNYKQKTTNANWLGRAWRGAFKRYFVAKEQKATANEIQKGGLTIHSEVVTKLIDGIRNSGVEAVVKENGEVKMLYGGEANDYTKETSTGKVELNEEDKAKLAHFNEVASKFSKMPYEWQVGDSTDKDKASWWSTTEKKHRAEFNKLQKDYEQAIQDIIKLKEKSLGDELKAAVAIKEIDYNVRMNQFLNTNPDVEKKLQEIKSNEVWAKALNSTIAERGLYMGFGGAMRLATTAVLGYTVAPLAAAVTAGHLAYRRAKETISETEQRARRGIKLETGEVSQLKQEIKQVKDNYKVSQEQLNQKLAELGVSDIDKIEGEIPADIKDLKQNINSSIEEVSRLETLVREVRSKSGEKPVTDAATLSDKIFRLTQQIETETDEAKQAKLRGLLKTRLAYTRNKLDKGLVNFGSGGQRLSEQYALLYLLSKAEATLAAGKAEQIKDSEGLTLEQRINRVLELNEQRISKQERKKIIKQVIVGGAIGAGFAGLGSYLAGLLRGGSVAAHEVKQPVIKGETPISAPEPSEVRPPVGFEHPESIPNPTEKVGSAVVTTEAMADASKVKPSVSFEQPESTHGTEEIGARLTKNFDITTAKAGEGIESKGIQQILDNPKKFGFTGEVSNKTDVQAFANKLAHEAAFNTKIGDGAVVGTTETGEVYDLRLKGSAIGEQIELKQGPGGKWHYEFGKGLNERDIYQHIEKTQIGQPVESPAHEAVNAEWHKAEFPQWSDKEIAWREALPSELPPDSTLSDVSMRVVDIDGDGQADTYFLYDIDDKQVIDQVILEKGETNAQLLEQAQTMYQQAGQEAKTLGQIVGEAGKSWDTGDRIIFSRGLGVEFKNGAFNQSSISILKQAVDKLGQQAPEFMRDHNLGEYIKGHLEQITCEHIEKMHEQGITLHQAGWKEIDYNYVAEMAKHNRVTDGIKLETKLLSPATNKNLAVQFIDKNKFNESTVMQTYDLGKTAQLELTDYVKSLKSRFELVPAAGDYNLVNKVLSLDTKIPLASFKSGYGGEQQVMIDKLYQELNKTLGGKLSQGTLSGSIGENLERAVLDHELKPTMSIGTVEVGPVSTVDEAIRQQLLEEQKLINKAKALEQNFREESLLNKAKQLSK
ncbi:MAG: hypothetical protein V1712_03900 [Patescibacteria group bacterium]